MLKECLLKDYNLREEQIEVTVPGIEDRSIQHSKNMRHNRFTEKGIYTMVC